jgi:hypothetical protein
MFSNSPYRQATERSLSPDFPNNNNNNTRKDAEVEHFMSNNNNVNSGNVISFKPPRASPFARKVSDNGSVAANSRKKMSTEVNIAILHRY